MRNIEEGNREGKNVAAIVVEHRICITRKSAFLVALGSEQKIKFETNFHQLGTQSHNRTEEKLLTSAKPLSS